MLIDVAELRKEIHCLHRRRYPDFVFSRQGQLTGDEIPVFTLHSVEPAAFEKQLEYLAGNRYRTLSADEFSDIIRGGRRPDQRSLLLTVDDGRRSVWTHAYPLLKKYDLRAVVFLVTGFVQDDDRCRPNLDDYWQGRCEYRELGGDLDPGNPLVNWPEVECMHRSGVVDFQSHTQYHHHVFTGETIRGFHHPGNRVMCYDLPVPVGFEEGLQGGSTESLYGMPVFESDALMAGRPRYLNDISLTDRCIRHVADAGGVEFFRNPAWLRDLQDLCRDWRNRVGDTSRFQDGEEMRRSIRDDLQASRAAIEERLSGKRVRHLCYPYGVGSDLAVQISRELGFVTNFWSIREDRRTNRPGDDPYSCVRLKADYIYRLPGRGRRSLLAVLGTKAGKRMGRALDYGGLSRPGEQG